MSSQAVLEVVAATIIRWPGEASVSVRLKEFIVKQEMSPTIENMGFVEHSLVFILAVSVNASIKFRR